MTNRLPIPDPPYDGSCLCGAVCRALKTRLLMIEAFNRICGRQR